MKITRRHPKVRKNHITTQKYQPSNKDGNNKDKESIEEYRDAFNTDWIDTETSTDNKDTTNE